jgi:hypothetical protein
MDRDVPVEEIRSVEVLAAQLAAKGTGILM